MSKNVIEVAPAKFPWLDTRRYSFSMAVGENGLMYLPGQSGSPRSATASTMQATFERQGSYSRSLSGRQR